MTAHLALRYARLGTVVAAGGDAVAVGESSVPLALGERQTVHALLAALIVHSANDASVVLAHAVMEQPAAQAAAAAAARRAAPAAAGRSRRALRAAHERGGAQRSGCATPSTARRTASTSPARTPRRATCSTLARLDMASPIFRALAGRRTVAIPGHRLQTSNTLLRVYAGLDGVKTGHTDEAGWNLAASADRGGVRLYAILLGSPDEAHRDRDVARLLDWGFDRYKRARLVRDGQSFGHAGSVRVVAARGLAVTLDPGEQVRERIVLPRRLDRHVARGERLGYVELRSARGVIGRVAARRRPRRRRASRRSCPGCARELSRRCP